MNLNTITPKLGEMAKRIEADNGPLYFLALLLREDSPDLWDFAVGSEQLRVDQRSSYEYVADLLRAKLTSKELHDISRAVILDRRSGLKSFVDEYRGQSGLVEVPFISPGGAVVQQAYIAVADAAKLAHVHGSMNGTKTLRASKRKTIGKTKKPSTTRRAMA